jgi:hypothetical protein
MAIKRKPRDKATTTIVGFHDLLGFGALLSASGGTLDSAAGAIAYNRILGLRKSLDSVYAQFPKGTLFFHFNDTLTACLDVDIDIGSAHTDASFVSMAKPERNEALKVIRFIAASATLHRQIVVHEEDERLGPAGRTFVVMGKRWQIDVPHRAQISEPPMLQANLAFAEAYHADKAGSAAGFTHRMLERFYVNDLVYFLLEFSGEFLLPREKAELDRFGTIGRPFPYSLRTQGADEIEVTIFHRPRKFYSLMSDHVRNMEPILAHARSS